MPASSFIVTPTPPTTLTLAIGEEGRFRFTVTSLAAPEKMQDVSVRAYLVGKDGGGGRREEVDWLSAEPQQQLTLTGGKTEIATIVVRPTAKTPRGENFIQLAIFDDDRPNDAFTYSTPVTCEVLGSGETPKAKPVLPPWLIPVVAAAGALGLAGIVIGLVASRSAAASVRTPPGTIAAFAGPTPPDGWLPCDGKAVSRAGNSALFAAIGIAWGGGDGTTTFNVPDLRGMFLRGADEESHVPPVDRGLKERKALDGSQSTGVASIQAAATAMPRNPLTTATVGDHTHQSSTWTGQPGGFEVASTSSGFDYIGGPPTSPAGAHNHTLVGGDPETRPVNAAVTYVIKL